MIVRAGAHIIRCWVLIISSTVSKTATTSNSMCWQAVKWLNSWCESEQQAQVFFSTYCRGHALLQRCSWGNSFEEPCRWCSKYKESKNQRIQQPVSICKMLIGILAGLWYHSIAAWIYFSIRQIVHHGPAYFAGNWLDNMMFVVTDVWTWPIMFNLPRCMKAYILIWAAHACSFGQLTGKPPGKLMYDCSVSCHDEMPNSTEQDQITDQTSPAC